MAACWRACAVLCLTFFCLLCCGAENDVHEDRQPRPLSSMRLLNKLAETKEGLLLLHKLVSGKDDQLGQSRDEEQESRDVHVLRQLLTGLDPGRSSAQKRTCKVNLGGHCSTENAVAMADRWNFLSGANSPGRRRRRRYVSKRLLQHAMPLD